MSEPDDRFSDSPAPEATELRPIQIPDLRKRTPLWRRALFGLGVLAAGVAVVAVCVVLYRWSEHRKLESAVRRSFQEQLGKTVQSIQLNEKSEGEYRGTILTTDGAEWRLIVSLTAGGQMMRWSARPTPAVVEAEIRKDLEAGGDVRVKSIDIKEEEHGRYRGTITLENGEEYDLTEDDKQQFHYEWTRGTYEKWVRERAKGELNDVLVSINLERLGPDRYRGGAKGESGLDYMILIDPENVEGKVETRLRMHPPADQYERWVRRGLENLFAAKVKAIELKPRNQGDHAGTATLSNGEVYDVRVGVPPTWRRTPRDGEVTWRVALQAGCYEAWIKAGIEDHYKAKVKSLKLKRELNGQYGGIAILETGNRFQVLAGALKRDRAKVVLREWPELGPMPGELMWETIPLP